MSTLIAYGTKHGCTEKWAIKLAEKIQGEVKVVNLKKCKCINLDEFDKVIIGSAIYAGRIKKEVRRFAVKNLNELLGKKVGLFICCMSHDHTVDSVEDSFPLELVENALVRSTFAGEFNVSRMNLFEKAIVKYVSKNRVLKPIFTNIEGFARAVNEG